MASKRKNNPNQPELPIEGSPGTGGKPKPDQKADAKAPEGSNGETAKPKKSASNGNGHGTSTSIGSSFFTFTTVHFGAKDSYFSWR